MTLDDDASGGETNAHPHLFESGGVGRIEEIEALVRKSGVQADAIVAHEERAVLPGRLLSDQDLWLGDRFGEAPRIFEQLPHQHSQHSGVALEGDGGFDDPLDVRTL